MKEKKKRQVDRHRCFRMALSYNSCKGTGLWLKYNSRNSMGVPQEGHFKGSYPKESRMESRQRLKERNILCFSFEIAL